MRFYSSGTSVTIGLPSFMTSGHHEKLILVVYFILFFILTPLLVWSCAARLQRYHDNGTMVYTIDLFVRFVEDNWTAKFLVQTLSGAEELQYENANDII